MTALSVIPRHEVPRNPSTSFGVPYRRDQLKRDVAPTMNDPVNVIMTQSVSLGMTKRRAGMTKRRARRDSLFYLSCRANARHPIRKPLTSSSNIFEHPQNKGIQKTQRRSNYTHSISPLTTSLYLSRLPSATIPTIPFRA